MAPEQVRGQDLRTTARTSSRSAWSSTRWSRVSTPFRGASAAEVMDAIVKEEPRPLAEVSNILPPALDRVVSRCLRKDPGERFQSMRRSNGRSRLALGESGDRRAARSRAGEHGEPAAPPGSALRPPLSPHSSGSGGGRPGTDIRRRSASRSWFPCFRVPTAHRASHRTGA